MCDIHPSEMIHRSGTTLKPLTVYYLSTVQFSAGKLWVLAFVWKLF